MKPTFTDHLQLAQEAARLAGAVIAKKQDHLVAEEKSTGNLVTDADLAAQRAIIKAIKNTFPEHSIIAEEEDLKANIDAADLWIIDPLDGTNNFAHNIPHYCVSIAYARFGSVIAGVVLDPLRDEMFSAVKGNGAYINEKPLRVSSTSDLSKALIATGFYYDRGELMRKTLKSVEKLFEANIHGIRRFGSAALDLCWLACGRFDAYFEYKLSTWDFAAGMLIVEEAGGRLTNQYGQALNLNSTGLTAANGQLIDDFLAVVRQEQTFTL